MITASAVHCCDFVHRLYTSLHYSLMLCWSSSSSKGWDCLEWKTDWNDLYLMWVSDCWVTIKRHLCPVFYRTNTRFYKRNELALKSAFFQYENVHWCCLLAQLKLLTLDRITLVLSYISAYKVLNQIIYNFQYR